jgi:hypothetical protein
MVAVKKFLKQNFVAVCGAAAAAFVLAGFAWAYFALRAAAAGSPTGMGTPLILHFNDVNGITSVGGLGAIVFMGLFGLLVVGMDFAIAREFEKRGEGGIEGAVAARTRFFARFLAATTLLFAILLFISFAAIINVNV